jgi:hypothetical protein
LDKPIPGLLISPEEAARETSLVKLQSNLSAKTDARFRSPGEKSPGIRA